MKTTPKFLDIDERLVTAERLCEALDSYCVEIRRGSIGPEVSFLDYAGRLGWTLISQNNEGSRAP